MVRLEKRAEESPTLAMEIIKDLSTALKGRSRSSVDMRRKATDVLLKIDMPAGYKGFEYIVDVMQLYCEDEDWIDSKIMLVYGEIAKRNNTRDICVERSIRYAFSWVTEKSPQKELVQHYIGYGNRNKHMLIKLYRVLKAELEDEMEG